MTLWIEKHQIRWFWRNVQLITDPPLYVVPASAVQEQQSHPLCRNGPVSVSVLKKLYPFVDLLLPRVSLIGQPAVPCLSIPRFPPLVEHTA